MTETPETQPIGRHCCGNWRETGRRDPDTRADFLRGMGLIYADAGLMRDAAVFAELAEMQGERM